MVWIEILRYNSDIAKRYHGDHASGTMAQKAAILDPSDDNFKYLWTQESSLGNCICEPFARGQVLPITKFSILSLGQANKTTGNLLTRNQNFDMALEAVRPNF